MSSVWSIRWAALVAALCLSLAPHNAAQQRGRPPIDGGALKEWLSYVASDDLQGREVHSRGAELAASYIARHLAEWRIKPAGEDDSYFQPVKVFSGGDADPPEPSGSSRVPASSDAHSTTTRTSPVANNVVGIIEGSDPVLKDTYVAFGAHYDHIGHDRVLEGDGVVDGHPGGCVGQSRPLPRPGDVVNNGADDDGSGTVALMAIAKAFALGTRPKRSLLFVWHTGEEVGLQGSRHNAEYPIVPNEKIIAQLNVDMVGRNRCDEPAEANTIYLVGSDRISTDLHNVSEDANASLPQPMKLDYELNDPADPLALYTRSDHYSYAERGIPVIFYTTGLHRDYHYLTDEIEKIEWEKLTRVTQLVYATGQRLANLEHAPIRDNKGPRAGKGGGGKLR